MKKLEYYLANMFFLLNEYENSKELKDRFIDFYYNELDNKTRKKVDISSLWGIIYRKWQKL